MENFDSNQIISLLEQVFTGKGESEAASALAEFLTDDFSDTNNQAATAVKEILRLARSKLAPKAQKRFDDMLDVALARVDVKASIEYWLKDESGKAIKLKRAQKFIIDFIRYAHEDVMIPIVFAPMGLGKSSILMGLKAYEIGKDVNVLEQLICSSDDPAKVRGMGIQKILESPHFRKIFPNVRPNKKGPWTQHEMLVERTRASRRDEIFKDSEGDSGSIDFTIKCWGVTSNGLGSRANFSDFDDIATYENSILNPKEGKSISDILALKWFTRKKSPLGVEEEDYDRKKNPWRARIIGTPWAEDDPIYSLRTWADGAVVLIGVNKEVTAYNVQIWGLPDEYISLLRRKYGTGTVQFGTLPEDLTAWCKLNNLPIEKTYTLGDGEVLDKMNPPKATMEIPLSRPRVWYLEELKSAKDIKRDFDRPYRCHVMAEGELAFPNFERSLWKEYPGTPIPIQITKEPVVSNGLLTGWISRMVEPPDDYGLKIAFVDLAGANKPGTVLTTAVLTNKYRRRIVEMVYGAWAPAEISKQLTLLFARHPDLNVCYIESVSLQSLYVGELQLHPTDYPFWSKLCPFDKTTSYKNDEQIGILTMGVTLASGGFEIPDTRTMPGHGYNCACGYCVLIKDGMFQYRLAPITSDLLITLWGVHTQMPHSFKLVDPIPPTGFKAAQNGMDLLKSNGGGSILNRVIQGGNRPAPVQSSLQGDKSKDPWKTVSNF